MLVEAFTEGPFGGNGAAVVALDGPRPAPWLQAVAGSLRQSETAFLLQAPEGWMLRWFTPSCEVPLCGHATLAALLALGEWGVMVPGRKGLFHTRSGPLEVLLGAGEPLSGTIMLPAGELHPAGAPAGLVELLSQRLGCGVEAFWSSGLGYAVALVGPDAPLATMACLADGLEADLRRGLVLMQPLLPGATTPSIGGEIADYQLRFFAPGLGINEDPVTGSAHALVAPWWQERLGRDRIRGWQCSDRPGGMVCEGSGSGMIRLTGSGHLLWIGTLRTSSKACKPPWSVGSSAVVTPSAPDWSEWRTATHLPCFRPSGAIPS
jgi:PhzF family phenazine biosynthesis protein